jgi:Methyltransferase domain
MARCWKSPSPVRRHIQPELLDELPPDDTRAIHSRADLQRVNALMGNAGIMARALSEKGPGTFFSAFPGERRPNHFSLVELGGGDGTFLLALAKRVAPLTSMIGPVHAILVDQQSLLTGPTRTEFERLSWHVEPVKADVFDWLQHRSADIADLTIANLFLHHFTNDRLAALLHEASRHTRMFLACEPHRSRVAFAAAAMMGLIGCNSVTVHDAKISVRAGFLGRELSALWPRDGGWRLAEHKAGRFTHAFIAERKSGARGPATDV